MKVAFVYSLLVRLMLTCGSRVLNSFEVVTPAKGDVLVAGRPYTVKWTTVSAGRRVHVHLYVCKPPHCAKDSCGEFVSSLCPFDEGSGCPYGLRNGYAQLDVELPQSIGVSSDGYTILVTDAEDENHLGCSEEFHVVALADTTGTAGILTQRGSIGVFRVQQQRLEAAARTEYVPRTIYDADDRQEPGECEVALLGVEDLRDAPVNYIPDVGGNTLGSWRLLDTFDDGDVCGNASDRTTSTAAFDSAFARRDGAGLGNLLLQRVEYEGMRIPYESSIQSSLLTARIVSSVGTPGSILPSLPETLSYNGPYFTAHVTIHSFWSLPLLFHTPSVCQGADVTLDFYAAAAVGYVAEIGGVIYNEDVSNTTSEFHDFRSMVSMIILDDEAVEEFLSNQVYCDLAEEPWDGPAGWAECSSGTRHVNTSVLVGGCEVLVSPARWIAIGDYTDQTTDGISARVTRWWEQFNVHVLSILNQGSEANNAMITATNPYQVSTTQIGLPLDTANDTTEWILVLIVAVESLFVAVALAVSSGFGNMRLKRSNRPLSVTQEERIVVTGKVVSVAIFLILGLVPVIIARGSELGADSMAHNDVYSHYTEKAICYPVTWFSPNYTEWCVTTRVSSHSLLVRSYSRTFLGRYDTLVVTSICVGAVALVSYAALSARKVIIGRRA